MVEIVIKKEEGRRRRRRWRCCCNNQKQQQHQESRRRSSSSFFCCCYGGYGYGYGCGDDDGCCATSAIMGRSRSRSSSSSFFSSSLLFLVGLLIFFIWIIVLLLLVFYITYHVGEQQEQQHDEIYYYYFLFLNNNNNTNNKKKQSHNNNHNQKQSTSGVIIMIDNNTTTNNEKRLRSNTTLSSPLLPSTTTKTTKTSSSQAQAQHEQLITIAHVISLITCDESRQPPKKGISSSSSPSRRVRGFLDALIVLRHSIHQNSMHNSNHNNSTSNPSTSNNRYGYQMHAFIHRDSDCIQYESLLNRLGYITSIVDTPVNITSSRRIFNYTSTSNTTTTTPNISDNNNSNDWYSEHVEYEKCCGSKEFIKLYSYTLVQYPIVVHWDIDTLVLKPTINELFDIMLLYNNNHNHNSSKKNDDDDDDRGSRRIAAAAAALSNIQIQRPKTQHIPSMNNNNNYSNLNAFYTRDITSSRPWERISPIQGGFLILKPNNTHFQILLNIIQHTQYIKGRGPNSGWNGMGYGGFQGAMTYQGLLAYFYDVILRQHDGQYSSNSIELDVCRWNQVAADIIWRGPEKMEHFGQCRQYPAPPSSSPITTTTTTVGDDTAATGEAGYGSTGAAGGGGGGVIADANVIVDFHKNTPEYGQCEDCRITPIDEINTVHYTATRKPWECTLPYPRRIPNSKMRRKRHEYRLRELTNITTAGLLLKQFFIYRRDIEQRIRDAINNNNNNKNKNNIHHDHDNNISSSNNAINNVVVVSNNNNNNNKDDDDNVAISNTYHPEYFLGYCKQKGSYIPMEQLPEDFDMKQVYGF